MRSGFNIILLRFALGFRSVTKQVGYCAIIFLKIAGANGGNVISCDFRNAVEICVDVIQAVKGLNLSEQNSLIQSPFAGQNEMGFDLMFSPLNFVRRYSNFCDLVEFVMDAR